MAVSGENREAAERAVRCLGSEDRWAALRQAVLTMADEIDAGRAGPAMLAQYLNALRDVQEVVVGADDELQAQIDAFSEMGD